MARILILAHRYDLFERRHFLVKAMFPAWEALGHTIAIHEGDENVPNADAVLIHVDRTAIPKRYLDAVAHIPIVLNGRCRDIGKRVISELLVQPDDAYAGPVIVKTNLNAGGVPEQEHARAEGGAFQPRMTVIRGDYPIYDRKAAVPANVWTDAGLVVERFLPERDPQGFAMRAWVFCGDRERCSRYVAKEPIVKAGKAVSRSMVPVPDALRATRARLGFDYGKFDFVEVGGKAILLDANRTPTAPPWMDDELKAAYIRLGEGIRALVR